MGAVAHVTTMREIRFSLNCSGHTVATIASQVGFALSDAETLVVLDHIEREANHLARSVTLDAVHARIADLVRIIQSTRQLSAGA